MWNLLPPSAPSAGRLPTALLQAAVFGLIAALPVGLLLNAVNSMTFGQDRIATIGTATWLLSAAWYGPAYAVTFYLVSALPAQFVQRYLVGASLVLRTSMSMGAAIGGGLLAYSAVATVRGQAPFAALSHMAILDGFVVLGIITAASVWRQRVSEKALAAVRAQSRVLQAQINPHFFFNTLNTISSLIPVDPHGAQQTVGRLADMSRYAFSGTERQKASLAEEIEFVRAYLEIEHTRFGDRLRFELPCSAQTEGLELPPLSIQPLVENAVRHGIARRADGGAVSVRVHRDGPHFVVVVENDTDEAVEVVEATFFRPGHALANIRDRLRLIYGERASVAVSAPRPQTVAVTIRAVTQPS